MRDVFIATLTEIAERDPRVMLITGDLGFGVLTDFASRFPKQFVNAGVAEQNMTGLATGLALEGHIVFTYSIANFPILRCLEQIRNDAAYHDANVKIVSIGGGFSYGALGMSHHATEDLAILRALPQVTVVSPGCLWEVEAATRTIVDTPGTCYLRLDKTHAGRTNREGEEFVLSMPRRLRTGDDVTVITTGGLLAEALEAADDMAEHSVSCDLFSVHTLSPIEAGPLIDSMKKTRRVLIVEEHVIEGGLAGLVAEICLDECLHLQGSRRLGVKGKYSSVVGSQQYLRSRHGMDKAAISRGIQELLQCSRSR